MFDFLKSKKSDEERSRLYIQLVFDSGNATSSAIAQALLMITEGAVTFPINDDVDCLISFAILGTSIGALKEHTKVMSGERGRQIEMICKATIEKDWGLSIDSTGKMSELIDTYISSFETSPGNPFDAAAELILFHCLDTETITTLFIPGTSHINPLVLQVISDVVSMTVTKLLTSWK